jgi:hypothetical protein
MEFRYSYSLKKANNRSCNSFLRCSSERHRRPTLSKHNWSFRGRKSRYRELLGGGRKTNRPYRSRHFSLDRSHLRARVRQSDRSPRELSHTQDSDKARRRRPAVGCGLQLGTVVHFGGTPGLGCRRYRSLSGRDHGCPQSLSERAKRDVRLWRCSFSTF